jgi:hypothetical protein
VFTSFVVVVRPALMALLLLVGASCSTSGVAHTDLPINDNFDEDCDGWATDEDENVSLSCENGQYEVLFKSTANQASHFIPRRSKEPVESVGVQADVTLKTVEGKADEQFVAAGIGCWTSSADEPIQGYIFAISPRTHAYAILKNDEKDKSIEDQFYLRALVDESSDLVAGVGEQNQMRGECRHTDNGVELTMWLNGEEVGSATDENGFTEYEAFGFADYSTDAGTDIRYDNFVAEEVH